MSLSRADAAARLGRMIPEWLAEIGIAPVDTTAGVADVIDTALLLTGIAYQDLAGATVADGEVLGFLRVLELEGLRRVLRAIEVTAFDTRVEGAVDLKFSQRIDRLKSRIALLETSAAPYITSASSDWSTGVISLGSIYQREDVA